MPQNLPGGLVVYTCAEWGARPPRHVLNETTPFDMIVHHMDTQNRSPLADHSAAVLKAFQIARECQSDHMDHNGWADTGQQFTAIDGICLEGRHGSMAALLAGHCIRGAHAADAGGDDNDSWGTEHEGTYNTVSMPTAQWNASATNRGDCVIRLGQSVHWVKWFGRGCSQFNDR